MVVPKRKINFQIICMDNKDYLNTQIALKLAIYDRLSKSDYEGVQILVDHYKKYFSKIVEDFSNED